MKKIISLLLITLIYTTSFSQSFEGKIEYVNAYKSRIPNYTDAQLTEMLGTKQEFYIKDGDYKSVLNGTYVQWQRYVNSENTLYTKTSNNAIPMKQDASTNPDEITDTVINKNALEILGYSCDEIIFTCKSGTQKYYFNSKLAVDPKLFAKHQFGNWSALVSLAKALPLKSIIETAQFSLENTAVAVTPQKLKKDFFMQ